MKIKTLLQQLNKQLQRCSFTPRLDAELLIAYALNKPRAYLYSHSDEDLNKDAEKSLMSLAKRLIKGEPIAYLLGKKEFYSLELTVNHDVLIPRPETECLVEWVLANIEESGELCVADLGTGSGAIAIALAHNRPHWQVLATDISDKALQVAKHNVEKHHLSNIECYLGNWCQALPEKKFDVIISNPPYIASKDPHLKALSYEPKQALVSGKYGLCDIPEIITQATHQLKNGGTLVLEHGYHQQVDIVLMFENAGYTHIETHNDLAEIPRFVTAKWRSE